MKKKIKTALISVYNKDSLDLIINKLVNLKIKLYSTGGTQDYIENLGQKVTPVEKITSYPSILGGRVKTLHPKIFGGILNRSKNKSDQKELTQFDIGYWIDDLTYECEEAPDSYCNIQADTTNIWLKK